jgi:tRNA(fMet)-specific endonuclease VapC
LLVLDTDHVSLLQRADSPEGINILARLRASGQSFIATSIITFEEQARGWLAQVSTARTPARLVAAYHRLSKLLDDYRDVTIVGFDAAAAREFDRLTRSKLRVKTMDLRIAAVTLSRQATLLTRNRADFARIPGLAFEDWTT